jgi:cell division protein FtsB
MKFRKLNMNRTKYALILLAFAMLIMHDSVPIEKADGALLQQSKLKAEIQTEKAENDETKEERVESKILPAEEVDPNLLKQSELKFFMQQN